MDLASVAISKVFLVISGSFFWEHLEQAVTSSNDNFSARNIDRGEQQFPSVIIDIFILSLLVACNGRRIVGQLEAISGH